MLNRQAFQIPFEFDAQALREELSSIPREQVKETYNPYVDAGDLEYLDLIEPILQQDGSIKFIPNQNLKGRPHLLEVLKHFPSEKKTYRMHTLNPGGEIREHRDNQRRYEDGDIRVHIALQSAAGMETYLNGEKIEIKEGSCWYLDLTLPHRMVNHSAVPRIHLIIDCYRNAWWDALFSEHAPEEQAPFANMSLEELESLQFQLLGFEGSAELTMLQEVALEIAARKAG